MGSVRRIVLVFRVVLVVPVGTGLRHEIRHGFSSHCFTTSTRPTDRRDREAFAHDRSGFQGFVASQEGLP